MSTSSERAAAREQALSARLFGAGSASVPDLSEHQLKHMDDDMVREVVLTCSSSR